MKFDYEIIKDAICQKDNSVKRENIIFENVYGPYNGYIMAPYRELIWSSRFSLEIEEYELRVKQKERNNKLKDILC
jgi:hypothetical protein